MPGSKVVKAIRKAEKFVEEHKVLKVVDDAGNALFRAAVKTGKVVKDTIKKKLEGEN